MTTHEDGAPAPAPVPPGFERLQRGGPFVAAFGPLYWRRDGEAVVIAMRIEERHTNMRGIAHGGMLAGLADCVLTMGMSIACDDRHTFVTANLTTDFVEAARRATGSRPCRRAAHRAPHGLRQLLPAGRRKTRPARQRGVRDDAPAHPGAAGAGF